MRSMQRHFTPCTSLLKSFALARRRSNVLLLAILLVIVGGAGLRLFSVYAVSLTTLGTPYAQSFDTLATSGTTNPWTDDTTIVGWYSQFTAVTTNPTTYRADAGGSNAGAIYSWGTGTATERAFGSVASGTPGDIYNALKLTNNTGSTITSLSISYTGEQWRQGGCTPTPCTPVAQKIDFQYQIANAGAITDANTPTTGWADHDPLDFTSPQPGTSTAAAIDGNAAANRTALSSTLTVTINAGQEIWLRWKDINDVGNDHGLSIDDFSVTPNGGMTQPTLNISDVTLAEGDPPGTTTFTFAVTLTASTVGAVTFDIATADGTAQDDNPATEDNDYVAQSLTGQSIPGGSTGPYNFSVTVNRDTVTEPNETFFVNVTNIVGATAGDVQGLGTINNDDVTVTPIHDIQGPGASSPIVGSSITTRGIVTGVKSNGFFIQEPDASVDADPATSEGIFVFTSSAPPAAAVLGAQVQVTGTVAEFVPSADPLQPPLTELTSPTVSQLSTGNPLPAAIPLTTTFPDPAGPHDQLERLEGMRVSVSSLTVIAPTGGNVNEPNATATSNGVFFGVVTGVARPFREPGIQAPDPAPSGSIPPIPRFDSNPERIRVDSDGLTGAPQINVSTGAVVTGLSGPLDYSFRTYTILPDAGSSPMATGGMTATPVTAPTSSEFTVASYNLERFFDDQDNLSLGEPVLTATAFNNRLNKASLGIRNFLRFPDVLGVIEVEDLATLQALATRINNDAVANSQPNPNYVAYLVEGNDIGGIDVGFLVKTAFVTGSTPRVTVNAVVQENDGEQFINPNSSTEDLNDRPPLRLDAVVNFPDGTSFPVTVIVVHQRSLNDVNSTAPGPNGWATVGERVRAKRQEQADSLANLVQARQTANANERIILVGDFNAFEFNDGFAHVMGTVQGTPAPDNETAVLSDGLDQVNPDLTLLLDAVAQRYSFLFDGNAQSLDHVVVNQALINTTAARRVEHPRINADFRATDRNLTTVERLADHDPLVAYFQLIVNAPPTIMAINQTRQQGSPAINAQIATVMDAEDPEDMLTVKVNGGTMATVNDVTVANIAVNAMGQVTANVIADCTATDASFTLTVTDLSGASSNTTLMVTVTMNTAPTLSYNSPQMVIEGGSLNVSPATATDNGTISGYIITSVMPPLSTPPGIDINGKVLITNAGPPGNHTITVQANDNCGAITITSFQLQVTACGTMLSKPDESFAANGGMGSFMVSISPSCSWTAVSNNPDWITITSPTGTATGPGTVTYTVASHGNLTPRSGTITVAGQTFTVLQGAQFLDVPLGHIFYTEIGKLSARGVTLGCGGGNFCPDSDVTRQQMAPLILRAKEGSGYLPPPATGTVFADVPADLLFAAFIEELYARGITSGCATGPLRYCPSDPVRRDQMAVFILRAKEGSGYTPPPATGTVFADVPANLLFAAFIEELYARGITSGCATGPLRYCPTSPVTRGQMAVFLVRAFNL